MLPPRRGHGPANWVVSTGCQQQRWLLPKVWFGGSFFGSFFYFSSLSIKVWYGSLKSLEHSALSAQSRRQYNRFRHLYPTSVEHSSIFDSQTCQFYILFFNYLWFSSISLRQDPPRISLNTIPLGCEAPRSPNQTKRQRSTRMRRQVNREGRRGHKWINADRKRITFALNRGTMQ